MKQEEAEKNDKKEGGAKATPSSTRKKVAPMRMCDLLKIIEQNDDEDEEFPPVSAPVPALPRPPVTLSPIVTSYKVNTPGPRAVGSRFTPRAKSSTSKLPKLCTGRTPTNKSAKKTPNSGRKTYSQIRSATKCALFPELISRPEIQSTPQNLFKKTENLNTIETYSINRIEMHELSEKPNKSSWHDNSFQNIANLSSNTILKNIREGITPLKINSGFETPITQPSKASHKKPRIPLLPLSVIPSLDLVEKEKQASAVLASNNKENVLPVDEIEAPLKKPISPPQDLTGNNTADTLSNLLQGMRLETPWKNNKPVDSEPKNCLQYSTQSEIKSVHRKLYSNNEIENQPHPVQHNENFVKPQPPTHHKNTGYHHDGFVKQTPELENPNVIYQCKPPIECQVQDLDKVAASLTEEALLQEAAKKANECNGRQFKTLSIKGKKYTIMAKLGVGGSSEVFKVMDVDSSAMFAVKCVNLAVDPALAKGYINEIKLLQQLQGSDRVIMMDGYEYVKEQKMLYVKLEMGEIDLSSLMKSYKARNQKLPLPILVGYWTEMLSAVNYIHTKGVIHSDLKPANFLLVRGRLKLIDFGIASSLASDATSIVKDSTAGTLNYISPEAVMGGCGGREPIKISYKSDVWSLGCILYSMIYGRTPFNDVPHISMKMAMLCNPNQVIDYPAIPGIPPVLIHAIKWCLTFDPKKRPTVQQLIDLPYINRAELNGNCSPNIQIPTPVLLKIKTALSSEEWKTFVDSLR